MEHEASHRFRHLWQLGCFAGDSRRRTRLRERPVSGYLIDYGPQPLECIAWAAADGLVLETLPWGEGRGVL